MTVAAYNKLHNPDIYKKLVAELETRFSNQAETLAFLELERLPFLTAVIKEGLRLSVGVIDRLPRVVSSPSATFNDHFLLAGTIVSMSSWMMHCDPAIFPEPMEFDPERWLQSPEQFRRLERNMVPLWPRHETLCRDAARLYGAVCHAGNVLEALSERATGV